MQWHQILYDGWSRKLLIWLWIRLRFLLKHFSLNSITFVLISASCFFLACRLLQFVGRDYFIVTYAFNMNKMSFFRLLTDFSILFHFIIQKFLFANIVSSKFHFQTFKSIFKSICWSFVCFKCSLSSILNLHGPRISNPPGYFKWSKTYTKWWNPNDDIIYFIINEITYFKSM